MSVSLLGLQSGRLLATYRRGQGKMSVDGNCFVSASDDDGRSWTEISNGFQTTWEGVEGERSAPPS